MFPFIELNRKDVMRSFDIADKAKQMQRRLGNLGGTFHQSTLDAILFSMRYLESLNYPFKEKRFLDCFASCAEACLYASLFGFRHLFSIERSDETFDAAVRFLEDNAEFIDYADIELVEGSVQDYFLCDFDVYFLDVSCFSKTMIDEGILINLFMRLCSGVLPGSYLVLVTGSMEIDPDDYIDDGTGMFEHRLSSPLGKLGLETGCVHIFRVVRNYEHGEEGEEDTETPSKDPEDRDEEGDPSS
jgi:hypothetical protein